MPILPRSMMRPTACTRTCSRVGITPHFPRPEYRLLSLAERLYDLSRELLHGAVPIEPDRDCIIRAHTRASNYIPPSLKGGEVKDSTIIEECLEVSRRLDVARFSPKRVFCTSNRRDYCETASHLHPSLARCSGRRASASRAAYPGLSTKSRKLDANRQFIDRRIGPLLDHE